MVACQQFRYFRDVLHLNAHKNYSIEKIQCDAKTQ